MDEMTTTYYQCLVFLFYHLLDSLFLKRYLSLFASLAFIAIPDM